MSWIIKTKILHQKYYDNLKVFSDFKDFHTLKIIPWLRICKMYPTCYNCLLLTKMSCFIWFFVSYTCVTRRHASSSSNLTKHYCWPENPLIWSQKKNNLVTKKQHPDNNHTKTHHNIFCVILVFVYKTTR